MISHPEPGTQEYVDWIDGMTRLPAGKVWSAGGLWAFAAVYLLTPGGPALINKMSMGKSCVLLGFRDGTLEPVEVDRELCVEPIR